MERIKGKDFLSPRLTKKFNNDVVAKFLMQLKRYNKFNKLYSENIDKDGIEFIDSVIDSLGIHYELDDIDIQRIPESGPFITVSNQPFGGIDGLLLLKIILEKRNDFKLLANYLLHSIEPLNHFSIPLNDSSNSSNKKFSFTNLKYTLQHIEEGKSLGIFPAAEISKVHSINNISDRKWQNSLIKLIKTAEVPVVPVYFQGSNSWIYHLLGNINPFLQTARLSKEFFNKKRKVIKIRIGKPISVNELKEFKDVEMTSRFLRAKTYALGSSLEVKKFFRPKFIARTKKVEEIIDPVPTHLIEKEIQMLKENYFLFDSNEYSIVCGPSFETPNILTEIGRLREMTFREVGEGTNRSLDIDEFDLYFYQLIIWDNDNKKIVGSYRVGRGDQIMQQFGVKGFYIQSLFNIKTGFYKVLEESLELGRSFIIKEYQRKPFSLFLLWKGILYFLLKNTEYRYLIGPASISNDFSKFSQSLIIDFFKSNYINEELAKYIAPRKRFKIKHNPNFDNEVFIQNTSSDVKKLDKFIQDIEPNYNTPVLFKKYIQLNAKLLGFNVDPKFNNCVDGLMILDIFDVPLNTLQALSKELEDKSILERFNF
jgi:putative hemolysin